MSSLPSVAARSDAPDLDSWITRLRGGKNGGSHGRSKYASSPGSPQSPAYKQAAAPSGGRPRTSGVCGRQEVAGGFCIGDIVASLITRSAPGGEPVVGVGQFGELLGLAEVPSAGGSPRFLIRFQPSKGIPGVACCLSMNQICHRGVLERGLPPRVLAGYTWGEEVRILVARLHPASTSLSLALGDSGNVIGPGTVRGKLAVRFHGGGEWSLWPSIVCRTQDYDDLISQPLAGGAKRGGTVRTLVQSCGAGQRLAAGQEGTVVGPGHVPDRLLVHFEVRGGCVWSLPFSQLDIDATKDVDCNSTCAGDSDDHLASSWSVEQGVALRKLRVETLRKSSSAVEIIAKPERRARQSVPGLTALRALAFMVGTRSKRRHSCSDMGLQDGDKSSRDVGKGRSPAAMP